MRSRSRIRPPASPAAGYATVPAEMKDRIATAGHLRSVRHIAQTVRMLLVFVARKEVHP